MMSVAADVGENMLDVAKDHDIDGVEGWQPHAQFLYAVANVNAANSVIDGWQFFSNIWIFLVFSPRMMGRN